MGAHRNRVAGDESNFAWEPTVIESLSVAARRRQRLGHQPQEIIHELDLLARVLDDACLRWLEDFDGEWQNGAVVRATGRLNRVPILLAGIIMGAFWEEDGTDQSRSTEQVRDFAATLSHELRTALGAAETAALMLEEDEIIKNGQERRRFAAIIQRNLHRAGRVITGVRNLVLADSGAGEEGGDAPLRAVLQSSTHELRELLASKGTRIEIVEPIPDLMVDAGRLEIILTNLIANAAKYSNPASTDRRVRVSFAPADSSQGHWWFEVTDNGLGIPQEHREKIFNRFYRAHPEVADGFGLGLPIVQKAVRQLGGEIRLESQEGEGTTFRILLPIPAGREENRGDGNSPTPPQ
jgi:signal transduction histidine kinase